MHYFFITRGIKEDVDKWAKFMETSSFYMPFKTLEGKTGLAPIHGILQPVQLWSYVFPKEARDSVLNSLNAANSGWIGSWKLKTIAKSLRVALGAKKIPDYDKTAMKMLMPDLKNIAFMPIGIKEDNDEVLSPFGVKNEQL